MNLIKIQFIDRPRICSFRLWCSSSLFLSWHVWIFGCLGCFCFVLLAADSSFSNLRDSCFFQLFFWSLSVELCTTCSSLHVCIRGCLSCFYGLRFYARLALINDYYECARVEHAHQIVSVNVNMFCFGSLYQVWL